ncbi:MAG: zinc ribbon domain-containing protein [Calditrichia bacterium]
MPIYEFYCQKCNTIYKFFSLKVNTKKIPHCPNCKTVKLKKKMSVFATLSRKGSSEMTEDMPQFDESRMETAMAMLAREADNIKEDDPRQAARLMRKLTDAAGMKVGPGMEEAIHRMERGEDPDKIEEEMGDLLEADEPFVFEEKKGKTVKKKKPRIDETLYDL